MNFKTRKEMFLAKIAGHDIDITTLIPPVAVNTTERLMLEIADRIDDMSNDGGGSGGGGTIDTGDIVEAVEDWLEENIDNPSNPPLDKSLSVEGAAADAKATGDILGGIFTAEAKMKLLSILRSVDAWTTSNASSEISELEALLFPGSEAVSITAVFDQDSNTIYDNDDLDYLRQYLTVTAEDATGGTNAVTDYTLSGTLTTGTSTITVTYGELTDTFDVTVTANDVRFCEWIASDDQTNWIKTNIKPSNSLGYKLKVLPLVQTSGVMMGCRTSNSVRYWTYVESNKIYVGWNTSIDTGKTYTNGTPFTIAVNYKNDRKVYVNDVATSVSLSTLPTIDWYIALLGRNNAGDKAGLPQKFYGVEFTDGDSVIADFVPAYKASNNEIGVYDKLSRTFYSNDNTGGTATGFTKGADV